MNREPMSDENFRALIKTMNDAKEIGYSRHTMAYVAIGAFESITNMTEEQVAILRPFLFGD